MLNSARTPVAAVVGLALASLAWSVTAAVPTAKPEEVGFSPERLRRVDEVIARHVQARNFSGAVTLVARHGRIVHHEGHGLMDLETKKPMQKDAIFRIMSMTKPVVGVAILMMLEEGKVRLTDPVSRFIPEFGNQVVGVQIAGAGGRGAGGGRGGEAGGGRGGAAAGGRGAAAPPAFYTMPAERAVTVRDLLTHTSAVVSGTISNSEAGRVAAGPKETLADYIPRLGKVPLEFQPGARWAYSAAAGFDVLSRIVEVASGMPIDRFVKTRIFDPLGMKDTTYIPPAGNPRLAKLYSRQGEELRPGNDPNFMNGIYFSGGGGLFSTAEDYLQFAQMLANDGQLNGQRLLSPRLVELMRSPFIPDTLPGRQAGEGFGLSVRVVTDPLKRNTFLSEGSFGWSGLYGTHFWVDPKEQIVGILMAQTSPAGVREVYENAVMQALVSPGPISR
jgi:CubicO group peptidase (beta-lactamase class C family)